MQFPPGLQSCRKNGDRYLKILVARIVTFLVICSFVVVSHSFRREGRGGKKNSTKVFFFFCTFFLVKTDVVRFLFSSSYFVCFVIFIFLLLLLKSN